MSDLTERTLKEGYDIQTRQRDRIRDLVAALAEAKAQRDSWKRIAESGLGITAETPAKPSSIFDENFGVRGTAFKETDCQHPADKLHFHGAITDNPDDYRCTVCNKILKFTRRQLAVYRAKQQAKTDSNDRADEIKQTAYGSTLRPPTSDRGVGK